MSKKTYILVDTLNMFFRAKHVGGGRDIDMRVGMAMHIMFNSIKKVWRDFDVETLILGVGIKGMPARENIVKRMFLKNGLRNADAGTFG